MKNYKNIRPIINNDDDNTMIILEKNFKRINTSPNMNIRDRNNLSKKNLNIHVLKLIILLMEQI